MHGVEELKNQLYKELYKISDKGEVSSVQTIDVIEKLACCIEKLNKIEEGEMDGYSGAGRYSRRADYYAPSGYGMNYSGANRGGRGGYSGNDNYVSRLEEIMYNSPDERTRSELEGILSRMRSM